MVVHPFGLVCTSDQQMKDLQDLLALRQTRDGGGPRKIDILEDCSECFNGGTSPRVVGSSDEKVDGDRHYGGSRYSDVHFFFRSE